MEKYITFMDWKKYKDVRKKKWRQPKCPLTDQQIKMWYTDIQQNATQP